MTEAPTFATIPVPPQSMIAPGVPIDPAWHRYFLELQRLMPVLQTLSTFADEANNGRIDDIAAINARAVIANAPQDNVSIPDASTAEVTATNAVDLTTAQNLANELKTDHNALLLTVNDLRASVASIVARLQALDLLKE